MSESDDNYEKIPIDSVKSIHPIVGVGVEKSRRKVDGELSSFFEIREADLIPRILEELSNYYHFFGFVIDPALEWPRQGWNYQILTCIPRAMLELSEHGKPGDIDVLILPIKDGNIYPLLAMAIEVKFIKVPLHKRWKDANSSGVEQAKGLLHDGFPFVGILHVLIAEPSDEKDWGKISTFIVTDRERQAGEKLDDNVDFDPILMDAVARQFGRMEKDVSGTLIGANAIHLWLSQDGRRIDGHSINRFILAQRNKNISERLMLGIKDFYEKFEAA